MFFRPIQRKILVKKKINTSTALIMVSAGNTTTDFRMERIMKILLSV